MALTTAATLASAVVSLAAHDDRHGQLCGSDPSYACGEILVILEKAPPYGIDRVIEEQGGDAERDLLYEFETVRDLLLPESQARDFSSATVYAIAVPVGTEETAARAYATDEAVYAATVNQETIGILTPSRGLKLTRRARDMWNGHVPSIATHGDSAASRRASRGSRRGLRLRT